MTDQVNPTTPTEGTASAQAEQTTQLLTGEVKAEQKTEQAQPDNKTLLGEEAPQAPQPISKDYLKDDGSVDTDKLWKQLQTKEEYIRSTRPTAPKSIDEYKYEFKPEDGIQFEEKSFTEFKGNLLKNGFSQQQFTFLMDNYGKIVEEARTALLANLPSEQKAATELQQEWGNDFAPKLNAANKAVSAFAPQGFDIKQHPILANDPAFIRIMAKVGEQLSEDSTPAVTTTSGTSITQEEVNELMRKPDYWTNKEAQAKVRAFYGT